VRIFEFLRKETTEPWTAVVILTVVSGIANGAILAIINTGASAAASDAVSLRLLLLFLTAMGTFAVAKRFSLTRTVAIVEAMVRRLRLRICDRIRRSDLTFIEKLGKGALYTTVAQDTNMISQAAFVITNAAQEIVMLAFGLVYIGYLSPVALLVVAGCIGFAVSIFQRRKTTLMSELGALAVLEGEFLEALNHIIDGFKEVRLNSRKNDALYESFEQLAGRTELLKRKTGVSLVTNVMFSQVFFYTLIAVVIFLLPRFFVPIRGVVTQLTAAILFIMAPLEMVVGSIPMVARSSVALDRLYGLEGQLDQHLSAAVNDSVDQSRFRDFHKVTLEGATFTYRDAGDGPGFTVGPVDIPIERGKTLFIVGGNGSGKSTLLKMLTGLYPVSSGTLRVDQVALQPADLPSYRDLISAIFTDFHLFDRLYGMEDVDEERVRGMIAEMELAGKTDFQNGRFTNLNLSTGQKKRLALIIALLEDREIYIFDEWAADQDVHFRENFYMSILPALRDAGKAVIAVTHDDRYWRHADRLIKLEGGLIVASTKSKGIKPKRAPGKTRKPAGEE
jgi:putative ATP-binding cassette transporter